MDDSILEDFLSEAKEGLEDLDSKLVQLEDNPNTSNLIADIFRVMHTIKGTAGFLDLNRLVAIAHASETLLDKYRSGGEVTSDGVTIILAALDAIKDLIADIESTGGKEPAGSDIVLIDLISDMADSVQDAMFENVSAVETDDDEALKDPEAPPEPKEEAPSAKVEHKVKADTKEENPLPPPKTDVTPAQNIRISVSLLDQLMDLVGELVLARNQILQVSRANPGSELATPVQNLSNITSELQENVMKTRMQPISAAFNVYPRVVRDLAVKLDKKIELKLLGETTEIDRQVLELIRDPLTHMVRNCADHALETPAERSKAGKSIAGTITLQAYHEGGHILIKIMDDGRGISVDKVATKAIEKGVITPEQRSNMSDDQIRALIFEKGFSTADAVTSVSGRGVGMDAVRDNIEKIGGTISVDSEEGRGTTFSIKIPLTLAIISSFVVAVGGKPFAMPQISVLEILDGGHESQHFNIDWVDGSPLLHLRGRIYPVIDLASVLQIDDGTQRTTLLCQVGAEIFGVMVDKVIGTEEIVVKPLSNALQDTTIYSGNTILGDGSVIMILDPNGLFSTFGIPPRVSEEHPIDGKEVKNKDAIQMVIFDTGDGRRKAVHLSVISRIDRIEQSRIQKIGEDRYLVQYEDTLMPVVAPDGGKIDESKDIQRLIVFTDEGKSMGFLVNEIFDISETDVVIDIASKVDGVIGNAVINGHSTEVLDASYFLEQSLSTWVQNEAVTSNENNLRIMIVDDSHFFRNIMHSTISSRGYKTESYEKPEEAQRLLMTEKYDVLVSDIEMPGLTGLDLIKNVRNSNGPNKRIPAIAISAHSHQDDKSAGSEAGFDQYLAKTDRDSIFEFLTEILNKKAERHE